MLKFISVKSRWQNVIDKAIALLQQHSTLARNPRSFRTGRFQGITDDRTALVFLERLELKLEQWREISENLSHGDRFPPQKPKQLETKIMLKNLLETWSILSPKEISCDLTGGKYKLNGLQAGQWKWRLISKDFEHLDDSILQGYVQNCIKDRDWYFALQQVSDYSKAEVRQKVGDYKLYQCGRESTDTSYVLLTAYLSAVAAQRSIGLVEEWSHFKGGLMEVEGLASYTEKLPDIRLYCGKFKLEENPDIFVNLYRFGENFAYASEVEIDHSDRVFYRHGSSQWARKVDNFLGLVGAEHPEHEGKLRFIKVGETS
jgi:hypothetical protein